MKYDISYGTYVTNCVTKVIDVGSLDDAIEHVNSIIDSVQKDSTINLLVFRVTNLETGKTEKEIIITTGT